MKNSCGRYSPEEISQFVDNELSQDKYHTLERHLSTCMDCRAIFDNYTAMSAAFSHHVQQQAAHIPTERITNHLHAKTKKQTKVLSENHFGFLGRHIYLKLASLAVILMISLFTFQSTIFPPTTPSAIVNSVDTDFASVMIIETQKKKHTIIWFTET